MLTKEQRAKEVADKGYTLVNDDGYKNLKSRIIVKCPKGHLIETCLEDFRKVSFECPQCDKAVNFVNPHSIPPKAPGTYRIIAFDQATEKFGLSIFDDGKLVYCSLYTFSGNFGARLVKITKLVRDYAIKQWQPDFICFEDIQQQHGVITFKILAELMGVITELCEEYDIPYDIVSPNVWRKYAGTAGKTRQEEKILSVAKVQSKYNIRVSDDVAESILIGSYAVKTHPQKMAFGK